MCCSYDRLGFGELLLFIKYCDSFLVDVCIVYNVVEVYIVWVIKCILGCI